MQADLAAQRLQWMRIAGLVAIAGAMVGMVGDYCLLYAPGGGYMDGDYGFLEGISMDRILWGHYLGILAIPFEAAGLYLIWLGLLPQGRKTAFAALFVGLYLMFLGVSYHGGIYPLADAVTVGNGKMELFRPFNEPLGLVFAASFFVSVLVLTIAILRGKTAFPKRIALASPLLSYGIVTAMVPLWPAAGNFLAPMGFNLCMAIFYGVLAMTAKTWVGAVFPSE
ncbi:MAG TPA: DUF6796 family protein [Bacteroidia bacterium]|nr:DUF6796 family protein [Bacteroidia bacterium]